MEAANIISTCFTDLKFLAPSADEAGQLMEWLTRNLDLCSSEARISAPPSCRSRYSYWIWDDPSTTYSPDSLFVFGGIPGAPAANDSTPATPFS